MDRKFNRDFLLALGRWKVRYWYGRYDLAVKSKGETIYLIKERL